MLQKIIEVPTRLAGFYRDVKVELKKVTWPKKKEVYGTTFVVLLSVFFFGFYLFVVDIVLQNGIDWIRSLFQ